MFILKCALKLVLKNILVNNVFIFDNVSVLSKQTQTSPLVIMQHILYIIRINAYRISEYKFSSSLLTIDYKASTFLINNSA